MISTSSFNVSSAPIVRSKSTVSNPHRSSVAFRRPVISAVSCASTVEKPRIASAEASSLYDVLGVPIGATQREIKTAYRRLARIVHPDVAANAGTSQTQNSAHEFLKIHEAYSTLSDPVKRDDYDLMLYRRRRLPVSISPAAASRFSGSAGVRRTWETDQCW